MYRGEVVHLLMEAGETRMWVNGVVRWCRKEQDDRRFKVGIQLDGRISEDHASEKTAVKGLDDLDLFPPTDA